MRSPTGAFCADRRVLLSLTLAHRGGEASLAVGNLYINRTCTGALVERHPFGGFKMSGIGGKAGGPDYLLQFVDARHVCENAMRRGFAPDLGSL